MPVLSIDRVKRFANRIIDPKIDPEGNQALVVMAATASGGTDPEELATYTNLPLDYVRVVVRRLQFCGIIDQIEMRVNVFKNPQETLNFVSVAQGLSIYDPKTGGFELTDLGREWAQKRIALVERKATALHLLEEIIKTSGMSALMLIVNMVLQQRKSLLESIEEYDRVASRETVVHQ